MNTICVVLAVVAAASALPYPDQFVPAVPPPEEPVLAPAPAVAVAPVAAPLRSDGYQYSYSVDDFASGDHKNQVERKDGEIVQGSYSLVEADGLSRRVVDYTADPLNGFNAQVRHEPTAVPEPVPVATPVVRAEPVAYAPPPVVQAEPVPYHPTPVVRAEPVAYHPAPVVRAEPVAYHPAPVVRAEPVAYHPAPVVRAEPVAYAPTPVAYHPAPVAPVVRAEPIPVQTHYTVPAVAVPPAVSTQSVTHTNQIVHPQQVVYQAPHLAFGAQRAIYGNSYLYK